MARKGDRMDADSRRRNTTVPSEFRGRMVVAHSRFAYSTGYAMDQELHADARLINCTV